MGQDVLTALGLTVLAGLATGVGSLVAFAFRKPSKMLLSVALGLSAGVMIYVSFVELLARAIGDIGFLKGNLAFFAGIAFIALIDILIPHDYIEESTSSENQRLLKAGLFTALGLAIHNFPEGLAVFMSSLDSLKTGVAIAVAIAIHNIPEGIAVSVPIFHATNNRKQAFLISFLSGLAEPAGALLGFFLLMPFITPGLMAGTLAFVAGIMVFICLDELIPVAHSYGHEHQVIIGIVVGMFVMALSLAAL
ncbi:zinc transporter ZupT [candidate division KSB1 bacterium]